MIGPSRSAGSWTGSAARGPVERHRPAAADGRARPADARGARPTGPTVGRLRRGARPDPLPPRRRTGRNPVVIGGDIHSFWVTDLKADFREPASTTVATEFVGTSVTSLGVPYDTFAASCRTTRTSASSTAGRAVRPVRGHAGALEDGLRCSTTCAIRAPPRTLPRSSSNRAPRRPARLSGGPRRPVRESPAAGRAS